MCCLFGFYNYGKEPIKDILDLTNILAKNATVRGTDATGIAFNHNRRLTIHKEAKSAYMMKLKHPSDVICVTGHTRHATQGDKKKNYNNHPFIGNLRNARFALSHNGVIINDDALRREYNLPKTKIDTDSYIAVQMIESKKQLNVESVKYMAENIRGSFSFSIIDTFNVLWLIKGDSPLTLIHLPKEKLYVYASTEEILYKSLVDTNLFKEIKKGNFEEIEIKCGDILRITSTGKIKTDKFKYMDYSDIHWWNYNAFDDEPTYVDDIKSVAVYHGYSPDDIDELLDNGFTPEEIEEYIYSVD